MLQVVTFHGRQLTNATEPQTLTLQPLCMYVATLCFGRKSFEHASYYMQQSKSLVLLAVQLSKLVGRANEGQQHASSASTMVTLLCCAGHYLADILA